MASAIKMEVDNNTTKILFCHGCLSQDRELKPLSEEIYKLYHSLLGSGMLYCSEVCMMCWECEAMLRRVRKFQDHIVQAQTELLGLIYNDSPKLETLSNLAITTKDYYDLHYEFIEQTYTQTDIEYMNNEYIETVPVSIPTSELPLIENCPVKIEKAEPELETSHSDFENDFDDNTNNFETSNESSSINNVIDDEGKTKNKTESLNEKNKDAKTKSKQHKKHNELSKISSAKYLKYATVRNINPKFENKERGHKLFVNYFTKEMLDLEQVEECYVKLQQNPCGERCQECRLEMRVDFLSIMRQNVGDITPDSTKNCLLCKQKFRNFKTLRKHWKSCHCEFYKCKLCNLYFKRSVRINHLNAQHTKVYTCKKCSGEFTSEYHFKLHFKTLHGTFVCHYCNKACSDRSTIIKHLINRHADRSAIPTKDRLLKLNVKDRLCTICNKVYAARRYLMAHLKAQHPDILNIKEDKESAYCVECDKQFKSVALFKIHLANTQHNPRLRQMHPCPECSKIFKLKKSLENHVHQVHMTEKARYICTICNKICCHKLSLKKHIERIHLKVPKKKDKFCDICGRAFHAMSTLKNHRRIHTGEKPYKCVHCPAAFAQQYPCVLHIKKVHNDMNTHTTASFLK